MKTRRDIAREECTRDPIFLFQYRTDRRQSWITETVFLTREEGEAWGEAHAYRWKFWQVYCVAATGAINEHLDDALACQEVADPSPAIPVDTGWRVAMHTDRATGLDIQWPCPKCGLGPVNHRDSSSDYADTFYHCLACDKRWCAEGADA